MLKKLLPLIMIAALHASLTAEPAFSLSYLAPTPDLDCSKGEELLEFIRSSGIAEAVITEKSEIVYFWEAEWFGLPPDDRYQLINGIAGAEKCLHGKFPTVIIMVNGEEVARADNLYGARLLKINP